MADIAFINAEQFFLRELQEKDLDGNWYRWFNDAQVTEYQNKKIFPNSLEKQSDYFKYLQTSKEDVVLAMVDKKTNRHVGNVGLHYIDWVHRSAQLGIVIGEKEFWGRKYGEEAWRLITEYAFRVLNLHRVYALVMQGNVASQRCAEKAGFKAEGKIRQVFYKDGEYQDVIYYNTLCND